MNALTLLCALAIAQPAGALVSTIHSPTPHAKDFFGASIEARPNGWFAAGDKGFDPLPGFGEAGGVWLTSGGSQQHIMNPSMNGADNFGDIVWANGSGLMVGAWRDDTGGTNSGAAHLFNLDGSFVQSYFNPSPNDDDRFGQAMALVGDNVLVTAYKDNTFAPLGGAAYLFDRSGNVLHTLHDPTPRSGDRFGFSADAWGDYALVGCYRESALAPNSGAVYMFDEAGVLARTFHNPQPGSGDLFGHAIAVSGNRLAVAATEDSSFSSMSGAVYVFDLESGSLLYSIANPSPDPLDEFGWSLQWVGDSLLVGAVGEDYLGLADSGIAYLFNGSGSLVLTLHNPEPAAGDVFGGSVAAVGRRLFVSASSDDAMGDDSGTVYEFAGPLPRRAVFGPGMLDGNYVQAVPEPWSVGLLATGLLLMAAWLRSRSA